MAFTRFFDDPCRIQKYLEESTNIGNYSMNVPGNGLTPSFFNDPFVKIQKFSDRNFRTCRIIFFLPG